MKTLLVITLLVFSACATDSYESYLDSLPSVELKHTTDAVSIVSNIMGISPNEVVSLKWVVAEIDKPDHEDTAGGVTIECSMWVQWINAEWTSGKSSEGPSISASNFAHEMAHCSLWILTGDGDQTHSNKDWWGVGGKVNTANHALASAGL